jgi:hypothetical protein
MISITFATFAGRVTGKNVGRATNISRKGRKNSAKIPWGFLLEEKNSGYSFTNLKVVTFLSASILT